MKALEKWQDKAQLKDGRILRGFLRHQQIDLSLNTSHITKIFKTLAKKANLNESAKWNISGHSARVGHAYDLLKEGKSLTQIMVSGGSGSQSISYYGILRIVISFYTTNGIPHLFE
jgi:hypothetical protein